MSQTYFDVIILGDSLASRIAAALLLQGGCKVLCFRHSSPAPPLFHSSLHLERLLERLDGRSCFAPPEPLQVVTPEHRLKFHHPTAVEEELRREFGRDHSATRHLLDVLGHLGRRLEETLWESGLPLPGIAGRLRFMRHRVVRGLSLSTLKTPFEQHLAGLRHAGARQVLKTLFEGMSLTPVAQLSTAEAALLWNGVVRAEGVSPDRLEGLLAHRYRQRGGETEDFSSLQGVQMDGGRLSGVQLQEGRHCGARAFLIGSAQGWNLLQQPLGLAFKSHTCRCRFHASILSGRISPMFLERVIPSAALPVRVHFGSAENEFSVECAAANPPSESLQSEMHGVLKPLLPFADLRLEPTGKPASVPAPGRAARFFPGAAAPVRLRKNVFLCQGSQTLPSLGVTGEVITGVSFADHLLRTLMKSR